MLGAVGSKGVGLAVRSGAGSSERAALSRAVQRSAGFSLLGAPQKTALTALLKGSDNGLSSRAHLFLGALAGAEGWERQPARVQKELLSTVFQDAWLPRKAGTYTQGPLPRLEPYVLGEPKLLPAGPFKGFKGEARLYEVRVGDQTFRVFEPVAGKVDKLFHHSVEDIARALATLPPALRKQVKEVVLNPIPNPKDALLTVSQGDYLKAQKGTERVDRVLESAGLAQATPDQRAWASRVLGTAFRQMDELEPARTVPAGQFHTYCSSAAGGRIRVFPTYQPYDPQDRLARTLVHETAHTWSKAAWSPDPADARWLPWKQAVDKDAFAPSRYGAARIKEDLAEAQVLYLLAQSPAARAELRSLLPRRMAILEAELRRIGHG